MYTTSVVLAYLDVLICASVYINFYFLYFSFFLFILFSWYFLWILWSDSNKDDDDDMRLPSQFSRTRQTKQVVAVRAGPKVPQRAAEWRCRRAAATTHDAVVTEVEAPT